MFLVNFLRQCAQLIRDHFATSRRKEDFVQEREILLRKRISGIDIRSIGKDA